MNEALMLTLCMEENTLLISNGVLGQLVQHVLAGQVMILEIDQQLLLIHLQHHLYSMRPLVPGRMQRVEAAEPRTGRYPGRNRRR